MSHWQYNEVLHNVWNRKGGSISILDCPIHSYVNHALEPLHFLVVDNDA